MKNIEYCINCGHEWTNTHYSNADGLLLASYHCSSCNHRIGIFAEDMKN